MESVGPVVLIVVTVAVGLALVAGAVQLWRHQPVHDDSADEETVDLGANQAPPVDEETLLLERRTPGDTDRAAHDPGDGTDDEETVDLHGGRS